MTEGTDSQVEEVQAATQTDETETATDTSLEAKEQPSGSADSGEQSFIDKFDPKQLEGKPELQAAYKQMQADYVRKTQELSEKRKSVESLENEAKTFRALMGNEQVKNQILDILKGGQGTRQKKEEEVVPQKDISEMTDEELIDYNKQLITQQAKTIVDQELAQLKPVHEAMLRSHLVSALGTVTSELTSKYEDFSEYEGKIAAQLAEVNPVTGRPLYFDLYLQGGGANGSNPLKERAESIYKSLAFDSLSKKIEQKAAEKIHQKKAANLAPSASTTATKEASSLKGEDPEARAYEALLEAKKQLGIESLSSLS